MITIYLLKSSLIWALSLLLYLFLFRNKAFFRTNRIFLIGSLLAGLLIPIIQQMEWLTVATTSPISHIILHPEIFVQQLPQIAATTLHKHIIQESTSTSLSNIVLWVYLLGTMISSIRFFVGLNAIRQIRNSGKPQIQSGLKLIVHNQDKLPFSFFNSIYLNENLIHHSSLATILDHEGAHIKGKHSVDIMLLELLKIILWFHPLVYFYKQLVKEVHEFIADSKACDSKCKVTYCHQLILTELSATTIAFGNNFSAHSLKKRITMLNKNTNRNNLSYVLILPVFFSMLLLWSCHSQEEPVENSTYEVAAQLEKILEKHYYNTSLIMSNYLGLVENYPTHRGYIESRIQKHFKSLGGEILFGESAINKELNEKEFFSPDQGYKNSMRYYIKTPTNQLSSLPTLRPIRERDLIKTVIPENRFHPIKKKNITHKGADYVANLGTPVLAAGDGLIAATHSYKKGYGNCIRIDHDNGMETFYAHLSEVLVRKGDYVEKGTTIGKVGQSGATLSPHLHFELLRDGKEWDLQVISQIVE